MDEASFWAWLARRQREMGYEGRDAQFAREVLRDQRGRGMPKATFSAYKTGRRQISPKFVQILQRAFPDECAEILRMADEAVAA